MIWKTERRKIADLNPAEYNPRSMTEKEVADLKASLDTFGVVDPVIINRNNTIIGGHQRIRLLSERGDTEIDVRCPDRLLTLDEEMELNVRLNKNTGHFDPDALCNFDEDLLKKVGFTEAELAEMFTEEKDDETALPFKLILNFKEEADWVAALDRLGVKPRPGAKSRNTEGNAAIEKIGGGS